MREREGEKAQEGRTERTISKLPFAIAFSYVLHCSGVLFLSVHGCVVIGRCRCSVLLLAASNRHFFVHSIPCIALNSVTFVFFFSFNFSLACCVQQPAILFELYEIMNYPKMTLGNELFKIRLPYSNVFHVI